MEFRLAIRTTRRALPGTGVRRDADEPAQSSTPEYEVTVCEVWRNETLLASFGRGYDDRQPSRLAVGATP